ncbi:MAG: hypothetical protein LQ338_008265, partial [Usnochroma carphineum]
MASVPIPPTNSTSPQAGNPSAGSNNAPPNANTPPPSASQPPNASQQSSNIFSRLAKWSNGAFSFANGIGTFALIAAFVFGTGAWVGMKIQISQGAKNMDLAIWTACADHEAIQHTKLCKTILAKDFSEFQKREEEKTGAKEVTIVVKRGIDEQVPAGPD